MFNYSIHDFDALTFEEERYRIFQQTEQSFSQSQYSDHSADFADGQYDAVIGADPTLDCWCSADYRHGYLSGVEEKFNDKFNQLI